MVIRQAIMKAGVSIKTCFDNRRLQASKRDMADVIVEH